MSKKQKTGIPRLIEIAGTKSVWLIFSMVLAIASSVAQFIPFISVYHILKELALHASAPSSINKDIIWHWGIIALAGVIIYGITLFISAMCSHIAAFNILYELRMALARKLVRLPMGFFTKRTSGEIKKIMSEDVERIELFVAHHIPDITCAVVFPLLMIGFLFYSDWRLALVILLVYTVALVLMFSMMSGKKIQEWNIKYQESLARMNATIIEYVSYVDKGDRHKYEGMNATIIEYVRGIQVVKIFNRSGNAFERLRQSIDDYRDFSVITTREYAPGYLTFYSIISSVFLFLIPAAIYFLLQSPSYPTYLPTVLLFFILGGGIFFPMMKLMWMGGLMSQNSIGVGLIDTILNSKEIPDPARSKQPENGSVEFRDVSFGYDKVPVLKNISFYAAPGTVTALVGPSGAGKSTIAMLAARFWDVSSGSVLLGGVPLPEIKTSDLMNRIAFVFQDNMLFFDTIEENIRMGNKTASREKVIQAAKAARCHEFIERLENGYQTLVGEGGTYLSGGEQQRIALARAILKDAPVILLDEATAYADPENEGKILESFSYLIKNKTVLVIAHRLSTITNADQILMIENGTIVERGKQEELLALQGRYASMWEIYAQSREWTINNN